MSILVRKLNSAKQQVIKSKISTLRFILSPFSTSPPPPPTANDAEVQLSRRLAQAFPDATSVQVSDVSGGCGAMFEIAVTSPSFKGLSIVKQHKLVTQALKEEIKDMHGLRIYTSPN